MNEEKPGLSGKGLEALKAACRAKAAQELTVTIRMAWWFRWYAYGVLAFALTFDMEPDWDKVRAMAVRAMVVE